MWKYIWGLLGSLAITIGAIVIFWPSIDSASNTTVVTINASHNSSNYTGLSSGIAFGPLLMWAVAIIVPLVIFAFLVWHKKQGG